MGYGLGAAIGAKMGCPEKTVVNIAGDGCFRMNMNELATAARCGRPLVQIVLNNHVLGMVRQWQHLIYHERYSETTLDRGPDFVKLAEAYGVKGLRATNKEEAKQVWQEAMDTPGPVLVEFVVERGENVYPMVTQGSTIDQMLLGEDE